MRQAIHFERTGIAYSAFFIQQEKEALDDLNMELELADEDQLVLCVVTALLSVLSAH